jgi:tetratricopeptide (TPR) repeat protein
LTELLGERAARRFVLSIALLKLKRTWRRFRYGIRPDQRGMASLLLCQAMQMLEAAEDVLARYEASVVCAGADIPPLALVRRLQHVVAPRGETARQYCQEAVAHSPNHADAQHELGLLKFAADDFTGALDAFERSLVSMPYTDPVAQKVNPGEPHLLARAAYHKGLAELKLGRSTEAILSFFVALWYQPGFAEANREIGRAALHTGLSRHCLHYCAASILGIGQNLPTLPALPVELDEFVAAVNRLIAQRQRIVLGRT